MTMTQGIDYGMGRSNVDESGIRYGVISQNSINLDCAEWDYDYGTPHCPKCGGEAKEIPTHTESSNPPGQWVSVVQDMPEAYEEYEGDQGGDYACESCKILIGDGLVYSDEAIGWSYEQDGYKLTDCLDNDIFVLGSPYYTVAQFCSPCVPGAGNLDSPYGPGDPASEDAPTDAEVKSYCLGPDWFDRHSPMPHRCFRVADNVEVFEDWVHCNQCQMLSINGTACHETGCPNSRKVWNVRTKEWGVEQDEE